MDNMSSWDPKQLAHFVQKTGQQNAAEIISKYKINGAKMKTIIEHRDEEITKTMNEAEKEILGQCIRQLSVGSAMKKKVAIIKCLMEHPRNEDKKLSRDSIVYLEPISVIRKQSVCKMHGPENQTPIDSSPTSKNKPKPCHIYQRFMAPVRDRAEDGGVRQSDDYSFHRYYRFVGYGKNKNEKLWEEIASTHSFNSEYIYAPAMMEPYNNTNVEQIKRSMALGDLLGSSIIDDQYVEVIEVASGADNFLKRSLPKESDSSKFSLCNCICKLSCLT